MKNSFEEIWNRIKEETGLKSLEALGQVIDKKQQTISYSKNKNEFSPTWAYMVGKKYGLLTEWIMTGEGPKRIEDASRERKIELLNDIEEWLGELTKKDPTREQWFEHQFKDSFKTFKKWKEEKEKSESSGNGFLSSKVA